MDPTHWLLMWQQMWTRAAPMMGGGMPPFGAQSPAAQRWAIEGQISMLTAYQALLRSMLSAPTEDLLKSVEAAAKALSDVGLAQQRALVEAQLTGVGQYLDRLKEMAREQESD